MIIPNSLSPINMPGATRTDDAAAYLQRVAADGGAVADGNALITSVNRLKIPNNMGANKYDSATLVLNAAGGYKAGKIYALKPVSGAADPPFTRNSAAYRRNSSGVLVSQAVDVPLINYSPGNQLPAFLFEPAVVNLVNSPNDYTSVNWVKTGLNITPNAITDPTGANGASKLIADNGVTATLVQFLPLIENNLYTVMTYFRVAELNTASIGLVIYSGAEIGLTINLLDNSFTTYGGAPLDVNVLTDGNFVYVYFTINAGSGATSPRIRYYFPDRVSIGNGSSGVYAWGSMVVEGRFPSSFTDGARAVSQFPIDDLQSDVFTANEGCFFIDLERMVSNNAGDAVLTLRLANNTEVVRFIANGVANQYLVNLPTLSASSAYNAGKKIAVAWNGTNVRISQGGTILATVNGSLGAVDQLRYTGTGLLEAYEMLGYNAAPTDSDLNALTA